MLTSPAHSNPAYADFVMSRATRISTSEDHLLHAAVGLLGEWLELEQASTFDEELGELGDVLYYFVLAEQWFFLKHLDYKPSYLSLLEDAFGSSLDVSSTLRQGRWSLNSLLNYAKKHWAYGQPPAHDGIAVELVGFLSHYSRYLGAARITLDQVIQHNVEKLTKRYPAGRFTSEHSQLRLDGTEDK